MDDDAIPDLPAAVGSFRAVHSLLARAFDSASSPTPPADPCLVASCGMRTPAVSARLLFSAPLERPTLPLKLNVSCRVAGSVTDCGC